MFYLVQRGVEVTPQEIHDFIRKVNICHDAENNGILHARQIMDRIDRNDEFIMDTLQIFFVRAQI